MTLLVLGDAYANARVRQALGTRSLTYKPLRGPACDPAGRRRSFTTIDFDRRTGAGGGALVDLLAGLDANTVALDGCPYIVNLFASQDLLDTLTVDLPSAACGCAPGHAASWPDPARDPAIGFAFTGVTVVGDALRIEFSRKPGKPSDALEY
ncbi:MAG: hypothetical protein U5L06_01780 [Rhodovibrio sp.]|nr:hypothetical protein [Rhodovibrio sp.]